MKVRTTKSNTKVVLVVIVVVLLVVLNIFSKEMGGDFI